MVKTVKDIAEIALYVLLGAIVMATLVIGALWLYGQPRKVRNTVGIILACADVLVLVGIFGSIYYEEKRRKS